MKVKIYGTRGSIPVCDKEYQEFGGNTPSVLVRTQNRVGILDAGTGIRQLGKDLLKCEAGECDYIYVAFSHFHWDHIQGFPFFLPAYDPKREIIISMIGKGTAAKDLKTILEHQMKQEYFPIPMNEMGAKLHFMHINRDEFSQEDFRIIAAEHNHPGGAVTYRIEADGKVLVYCTDIEHGDNLDPRIIEISKGADLLIHDAQYTPDELKLKKGWGHSSYTQAIELADKANVKKLLLTHHDPDHTDTVLNAIETQCKKVFDKVELARDMMEIDL